MITFIIDEIVPCLKLVENGELYETEVVRIKRKSVLMKYSEPPHTCTSRNGASIKWFTRLSV